GLLCSGEYCSDLFLPETTERLHGHFETLLQGIVAQPDRRVQHLPLLLKAEPHRLLQEWQGPADHTIPQTGLHQQIEQWAARQPEVVAVTDEQHTLTYRDLNQRANQLARLFV